MIAGLIEGAGPYRLVTTAHGVMLAHPDDLIIGRSLCRLGEYSGQEVDLLTALVSAEGVAVDVGAHIGAITVPLARRAGAVLAVEPQPGLFQVLCANVVLNDLDNVHTVNAAAGAAPATTVVGRVAIDRPLNTGGLSLTQLQTDDGVRVRIERLDDLIDPPRLDLIKVDVEGMEEAVLEGAAGLLGDHHPAVYVEVSTVEQMTRIAESLQGGLGYSVVAHRAPIHRRDNHAGATQSPWDRPMATINLLGLPPQRSLPAVARGQVQTVSSLLHEAER